MVSRRLLFLCLNICKARGALFAVARLGSCLVCGCCGGVVKFYSTDAVTETLRRAVRGRAARRRTSRRAPTSARVWATTKRTIARCAPAPGGSHCALKALGHLHAPHACLRRRAGSERKLQL